MKMNPRFNYIILLLVVFGGFLIFGLSENIRGPALPEIQSDFSLSEGQLGILLALNSFGFLLAVSFTSFLIDKIGIKITSTIMFTSMALSGVFIYLSVNFASLAASYFFLYIGNGMLEISLAIIAAKIFTKNTGTMLNLAHFFYGLGSTVAPIMAASVMGWNVLGGELGWQGMYMVMLSLSLLPIIPVLIAKFPRNEVDAEDRISLKHIIRDPIAWLLVVSLSFGVIAELGMSSWLVNYLAKVHNWGIEEASGMLSLFFLLFMFARLLLGPVTDKFGFAKSVIVFSLISGACSLLAIFIGERGAILFAIAGFGIAPVYPTMMAVISKRYAKGTDTMITFTVSLVGIGSVVGNLLTGYIIEIVTSLTAGISANNHIIGLQAGYGFISFSALLCALFCLIMFVMMRKRNEVV